MRHITVVIHSEHMTVMWVYVFWSFHEVDYSKNESDPETSQPSWRPLDVSSHRAGPPLTSNLPSLLANQPRTR